MKEINIFINTDDTLKILEFPHFKSIYSYVDEEGCEDPREWGKIVLDEYVLRIFAQSDVE